MSEVEILKIQDLHLHYGNFHALRGVSLEVNKGEVIVLLGPSGSGKSTLIRAISSLEPFQKGQLRVNGVELKAHGGLEQSHRHVGMVFQAFNLFPHLSILENITLAPRQVLKLSPGEAKERAMNLLSRVGIQDQAAKLPAQLSGGQQQRAAIARALAMQPQLMLFDEPTSALDPEMVAEVLDVMKGLTQTGMTMMVVTHELSFAREVADRIIFLNDGQILEQARPEEFFTHPQHARAQTFVKALLKP